jgi:hypothetical protein
MAKDKTMEKGQKRMIHTKIWLNESFSTMHPLSRLLYIGLVILADDDGRLKGNTTLLKSQIFPFDAKMKIETFKVLLKEVIKSKLVELYRVNGEYFLCHPNWKRYQYIRADLYKPSIFPENPLQTRDDAVTKKGTKEKKGKEREEKRSIDYLSKIPEEDKKLIFERFEITEKQLLSKAEDLKLYCEQKDRMYKDYKAFLFLALKKDFGPKKPKAIPRKPEEPKKEEPPAPGRPIPKDIKEGIGAIINKIKQDSK